MHKAVMRSTQSEEQASSSTSVNDAINIRHGINTHEGQQRTEPIRNYPSKNQKNIGPTCDIVDVVE